MYYIIQSSAHWKNILSTLSFRVSPKSGHYPTVVHSCLAPACYIHQHNLPFFPLQTTDPRELAFSETFRCDLRERWWCDMYRHRKGVSHVIIYTSFFRTCSGLILYIRFNFLMESCKISPKKNRRNEIIKIKAEINEIEMKKTIERIK